MMQTPRDDELVPLRRAALCLGVGQRLVYEARDRNELVVYRFNSRWCWVRWADAVAWLERHRCAVRQADADALEGGTR